MKIDLHIHSKTGSDGNLVIAEVFQEARRRHIDLMSITDHDSIDVQEMATSLAQLSGIGYLTGVELNITFPGPAGKTISLDFLGYRFDYRNQALLEKLRLLRQHREARAQQILENLNIELAKENIPLLTEVDLLGLQATVDGTLGRPHIADYLVQKGIVVSRQAAFDKYLVKCDVPKFPLSPEEAARLIRGAGGVVVLAHPNDPNGTSLVALTKDMAEQGEIIHQYLLPFIDGVECWHFRHSRETAQFYETFTRQYKLLATGGSDCHQKPVIMGTVTVPDYVAGSFSKPVG